MHRIARPAGPHQRVRASHFGSPIDEFARRFILHVDVKPNMRVRPLDFGDDPGQLDALCPIELCSERMVPNGGASAGRISRRVAASTNAFSITLRECCNSAGSTAAAERTDGILSADNTASAADTAIAAAVPLDFRDGL